jgi:hypothetical protein
MGPCPRGKVVTIAQEAETQRISYIYRYYAIYKDIPVCLYSRKADDFISRIQGCNTQLTTWPA